MQDPRSHTCCFSGYRPEKMPFRTNDPDAVQALEAALDRAVEHAVSQGYHTFLSGMAAGFDIWAAEAVIRPGVPMKDIDRAARKLIEDAGYGPFFTHRLGHFIGQTEHEKGDVSATNTTLAKPGMIFSIEPGVYLPGEFGVRVEDLVLVTEDGCEILNHVDKHWKSVG